MADITRRLFVITGGPGSGKTTLINALARRGYFTSEEAGRAIIKEQVKEGGSALPWSNPGAFAELMISHELRWYHKAVASGGLCFFDRGLPDVIGFLRLMALPVPAHLDAAVHACRYDTRVFIAPPWPDIFTQDVERKQTFAEAVATYEAMVDAYTASRYELTDLPLVTVSDRLEFVLDTVRTLS